MKFVRTPLFLTTTISSFLSLNVYAFHQFGVSPLELFHPKSEDHARIRRRPILSPTSYLLCPGTARQSSLINDNDIDDGDRPWLTTGLLISSFSDGIKPNPEAQDFLLRGLVKAMLTEKQRKAEISVHNSAIQSPCCGPDIGALNSLETADNALATLIEGQTPSTSTSWNDLVDSLLLDDEGSDELELRFLYIPTAMYALRADSQNTPGKQRQRARADGKKRRNEIVQLIKDKLGEKVSVLAVTLDFDDGSVKQPEGSDDKRRFPTVSSGERFTGRFLRENALIDYTAYLTIGWKGCNWKLESTLHIHTRRKYVLVVPLYRKGGLGTRFSRRMFWS